MRSAKYYSSLNSGDWIFMYPAANLCGPSLRRTLVLLGILFSIIQKHPSNAFELVVVPG